MRMQASIGWLFDWLVGLLVLKQAVTSQKGRGKLDSIHYSCILQQCSSPSHLAIKACDEKEHITLGHGQCNI